MFIPFFFTALLTLFSGPLACSGFSVQTPNFTQVTPILTGCILTNAPPFPVLTFGLGNVPSATRSICLGITQRAPTTSSLQIRATSAATQCEHNPFRVSYMRCSCLISCFPTAQTQRFLFHSSSGDLGQFTNNYATWTVSIPAGWTVVISVEDDLSDEAWSQPVRIYTTSFQNALVFNSRHHCP